MDADESGWNADDARYVAQCLGRVPKGVMGIASRDRLFRPTVITNKPVVFEGEKWIPFPTLYWLIDPRLNKQIADIERTGGVRAIEALLESDEALMRQHLRDNRDYAGTRWALLSRDEQQIAGAQGLVAVLQQSGIGGVANHRAVKCLHAQYAYHLAHHKGGTAVGRLMQEHFGIRFTV